MEHPVHHPNAQEVELDDENRLADLGYKQELTRDWSVMHNFGVSFSIIVSVLCSLDHGVDAYISRTECDYWYLDTSWVSMSFYQHQECIFRFALTSSIQSFHARSTAMPPRQCTSDCVPLKDTSYLEVLQ